MGKREGKRGEREKGEREREKEKKRNWDVTEKELRKERNKEKIVR